MTTASRDRLQRRLALVLLVLLALLVALVLRRRAEVTPEEELPVPAASARSPGDSAHAPGSTSLVPPKAKPGVKPSANPEEVIEEISDEIVEESPWPSSDYAQAGFLCRTPGGLLLKDGILMDGDDGDSWPDDETVLWSAKGIQSAPISDSNDFRPFLNGTAGTGSVPQAYVTIRGAGTPDSLYVYSCEILTPAWLAAFREMWQVRDRFLEAMKVPPSAGRRTAILEAAKATELALSRARQAREGEEPSSWRRNAEEKAGSAWAATTATRLTGTLQGPSGPLRESYSGPDSPRKDDVLGVAFNPLTEDERTAIAAEGGARVTWVDPSGPAAAAGLQAGDVIWQVNGHFPFDADGTPPFYHDEVNKDGSPAGWSVKLLRGGEAIELEVKK